MKILSLGWGVQSFTLAAMVALGELEPIDCAIHADTTHEASWTYEFAKKWTEWLETYGVKVITVKPPDASFYRCDKLNGLGCPPVYSLRVTDNTGYISVPFHQADEMKKHGQLMRSCTGRWKINPMRRWISQHIENKKPGTVEQWIGISLDEYQRMKQSDVKYIIHRWPLIEMRMTRNDCVLWLEKHNIELPKRSACVFCPFHRTSEWRNIKEIESDWKKAVMVDNAIRDARPPYRLFVHPSCKPLGEVDLRNAEEKGQLSLWDNECSGICGV